MISLADNFLKLPAKLALKGIYRLLTNFASVCFTNLSQRSNSNKTDAKLLTCELTILQIYRPYVILLVWFETR